MWWTIVSDEEKKLWWKIDVIRKKIRMKKHVYETTIVIKKYSAMTKIFDMSSFCHEKNHQELFL